MMAYSEKFLNELKAQNIDVNCLIDYSKIYDYSNDVPELNDIREKFNWETLYWILKYTDLDVNPMFFSAFVSKARYLIEEGAKGISKSFGSMIITVFLILHDLLFNSIWARNQYNHIQGTVRPTLKKALSYLKKNHDINLEPFFNVTQKTAYFNRTCKKDEAQKICFCNWEDIQSFQGLTLDVYGFYFGELVIDEPIENEKTTLLNLKQLETIYNIQKEQLPVIMDGTLERVDPPKHANLKCKFLFNLFNEEHWVVQDFLYKIIQLNESMINLILEKKFLHAHDMEFKSGYGVGLVANCYSKYFIPRLAKNEAYWEALDQLRKDNYRMWVITVVGLTFDEPDTSVNYYLKNIIYDETGVLIDRTYKEDISTQIKLGEIEAINDGYDHGIHDAAPWCRLALDKYGNYILIDVVKDIFLDDEYKKECIKNKTIHSKCVTQLLNIMQTSDRLLNLSPNSQIFLEFRKKYVPIVASDNDTIIAWINSEMRNKNYNAVCVAANRKDTATNKFSIKNRQAWWLRVLTTNKFWVCPGNEWVLPEIAKQVILDTDEQRNEDIHPEIYDLVNCIEFAASLTYKWQSAIATTPQGE